MTKFFEIRDPVHGFIRLNEWEMDLINHPCFQRLRRIRQLGWTEMVYPGATHTRFGHSLGVMHVATRLYLGLVDRYSDLLVNGLNFTRDSLSSRQKQLVRLAALLHDIGHAPFSHATEDLMPECTETGKKYTHEDYTIGIIKHGMRDVIENHPYNKKNYGLMVDDVIDFFRDMPKVENLLWRQLISGQLDADRMDYLLRDSHYAGVAYGKYDLDRIAATIALVNLPEQDCLTIGIDEDGVHAAEGLLIARYMLFTQVYFHKTRAIYDYHIKEVLGKMLELSSGCFPAPDSAENVQAFLNWDDWRIYGALSEEKGGEHGRIIKNRQHYRLLKETQEIPLPEELEVIDSLESDLVAQGINYVRIPAGKSWYKTGGDAEIYVGYSRSSLKNAVQALSSISSVVKGFVSVRQNRLYVSKEDRPSASDIAQKYSGFWSKGA